MIAIVGVFFGLLWFTVIVINLAPDRAFILSLATLILLSVGILFTSSTVRQDNDER